ncbi:MAG: hypothetical protein ABIU29_02330 [Chthoniobacterales bacterium]
MTGTEAKTVIVRGSGPSIALNGGPLADALSDPVLDLYQDGALLASNDNWKDAQGSDIEASGLAPANDKESAILRTLAPGSYTFVLRGQNGDTGVGLVEAYDLEPAANSFLANTSTRGFVKTDDNVLIAGFIICTSPARRSS